MEIAVALPFIIGLIAVGRIVYLKGWKGLMNAEFRPNVPHSVKIGLFGFFIIEFALGLMMQAKLIDASIAKFALSPVLASIIVSLMSGWVLALNWGERA